MDCILPDDSVLIKRNNNWEDLILKYSAKKQTTELGLNDIDDFCESLDNDTQKENEPEAEENLSQELQLIEAHPITITEALQSAIKEREACWRQKGITFTFDRVNEWLEQSDYQNQKVLVDPSTGSHTVEQTRHKKMHRKRSYRNGQVTCPQNSKTANDYLTESDTEISDSSSNTSVDTAQYIRANQHHRSSKVTKTIIKKYIVTSKHINHHKKTHRPLNTNRINNMPLQAITNDYAPDLQKKKRYRKKRHELNKRRRRQKDYSSDSDSTSDGYLEEERPRKNPLTKPKAILPAICQASKPTSKKPENTKHGHSFLLTDSEVKNIAMRQPKVVLDKNETRTLFTTHSSEFENSTCNVNNDTSCRQKNNFSDNSIQDSMSDKSKLSSFCNMSRKSWAHLPKKIVIYEPDMNTTSSPKINLTNEHFEKAIGVEATNDLFQGRPYEKAIDSSLKIILELPDDISDSDRDPLDYDLTSLVPNLTAVRDSS